MISEFLLNIVFFIVTGFFDMMPEVVWSVDTSAFGYFLDILRVCAYMLPMGHVGAVVALIFALTVFQIVIAFIKTLWDLLPFA